MTDIKALIERVKQQAEFDDDRAIASMNKLFPREQGYTNIHYVDLLQFAKWQHDQLQPLIQAQSEIIEGLWEALDNYYQAFPHDAPHDCFSTGPLTGNPIVDELICPGCIAQDSRAKALTQATDKLKGLVGE